MADKNKISKEDKAKLKLEKLEAKKLAKEEKIKMFKELKQGYEEHEKESKTVGYAKKQKIKKEKEKFDYKLALKEMPIKMIKEVNKIKWSTREILGMKFLWVIIFMLIFGIFFYFIDWGLEVLFTLAKII